MSHKVMGMTAVVEIPSLDDPAPFQAVFAHLEAVDRRFSPFRPESELCALNRAGTASGAAPDLSEQMRDVLALSEKTGAESRGYFRATRPDGTLDPSGVVKGWAVKGAADILRAAGHRHFCVEVAGDMEVAGLGPDRRPWRVGLANPFEPGGVVKVLALSDRGIATSGTATQGQHIYDPHRPGHAITRIVSLTVIGPDVLEADRFATAAFAMEDDGISFIEEIPGLEGYAIGSDRVATMTSGFKAYVAP